MTEAQDRELEEEARSLLSAVQAPEPAPAEVKARALRRLAVALPGLPGPGGGPGGGPAPPATGGQGSGGREGGSGAHGLGRALATRVPAWSVLASFLAGGALVGALAAARRAPDGAPTAAATAALSAAPSGAPSVAVLPPADVEAPSLGAPSAKTPSAPASAAPAVRATASAAGRPGGEGALEAERAVLDVARTALGRGDGGNALRAIDEHARKFPRGALAEEREAMAIQALRLLHRDDEAQARLGRFRGRFPTSLIRPALEADAGGGP